MENEQKKQEERNATTTINYYDYLNKNVKVKTIAGHEFNAYMDGLDGENLYLLIPFQLREQEERTEEESRAYAFPGYGYSYGYNYGYPGWGYSGYRYGRFILPIAALSTIAIH